MSAAKYDFPNPVLAAGLDDYKEGCEFSYLMEKDKITIDSKNIVIPVSYTLKCRGLERLVAEGRAAVVISAKSSMASFSRIKKFGAGETETLMKIPKFSVARNIEVTCSVIATEAISGFPFEDELNELYFGGVKFEIRKGDILAAAVRSIIDLDQNELEKNVTSVFTIGCAEDDSKQERDVMPDFSGDKIIITLKQELYQLYYELKDYEGGNLRRCVTAVVVYPVLVEAVGYIISHYQKKEDSDQDVWGETDLDEDLSRKRWFKNISAKIYDLGLDPTSLEETQSTIADALLKGISLNALKELKGFSGDDYGDDPTVEMEEDY